ncbi:MerR family transcriptional regulator [Floccifex sp.]|uniref:MerR family transcriptional regulator n=1 Tax=Floccifex sp. TaxID=2815810 RepID=UPI003F0FEACD
MKKYYKIKEIANLYNIQPDSLRYYEEMGLIKPLRSEKNYRLYTVNDIYRLNIIRDCLKLGYNTNQIKDYLQNRSLENTISFLEQEQKIVEEKIVEYQLTLSSIQNRIQSLQNLSNISFNQFQIKEFEPRYCHYLKEKIEENESIDYYLTKLSKDMEEEVTILGNFNSGSIINSKYQYNSVFIVSQSLPCDFILEKGKYCIFTYKGKHNRTPFYFQQMEQWLYNQGYEIKNGFLEFLLVDIHETMDENEYVTQIQAKIKDLAI